MNWETEAPLSAREIAEMEARHTGLESTENFKPFKPMKRSVMMANFPEQKPVVINGICRKGEVVNIIASSKIGKSWLAYEAVYSILTGDRFIGSFSSKKGRVLLVDNELTPETLQERLAKVEAAKEVDIEEIDADVDIVCFRGKDENLDSLEMYFSQIERGHYDLIVLDAWYRFIPAHVNENSNSDVTRLYNKLVRYAEGLDAAIMVIHHSSKGDQGGKEVTDVGSGAGAMSRAADSHLVIRPHSKDGLVVLDGVCRSFPPIEPVSMYFEFPCWQPSLEKPEVKRKLSHAEAKDIEDNKTLQAISEAFKDKFTPGMVRQMFGYGQDKTNRLCRLGESKKLWRRAGTRKPKNGKSKPQPLYRKTKSSTESSTDK